MFEGTDCLTLSQSYKSFKTLIVQPGLTLLETVLPRGPVIVLLHMSSTGRNLNKLNLVLNCFPRGPVRPLYS